MKKISLIAAVFSICAFVVGVALLRVHHRLADQSDDIRNSDERIRRLLVEYDSISTAAEIFGD